eukprot:9172071-Prorocentrum_lima.AAC.1
MLSSKRHPEPSCQYSTSTALTFLMCSGLSGSKSMSRSRRLVKVSDLIRSASDTRALASVIGACASSSP